MKNFIRFETLKNRAKKAIGYNSSSRSGLASSNLGWLHSTAFESLAYVAINFKQYVSNERPQLVEFAKTYQAGQLTRSHKSLNQPQKKLFLSLVCLTNLLYKH